MIRWTDAGQGGDVQLASLDTSVLRYDGQGRLVRPASRAAEDMSRKEESGRGTTRHGPDTGRLAAPRETLSAIRLIANRYQNHAALERLELSPKHWTAFFQAMIQIESGYSQSAVSSAGALGLAQLMPDTAKDLRVDPADPLQNLDGGARYLLAQMQDFESLTLALAAYNAGPAAVRKHGGVPPYRETRNHIVKVMAAYDRILAEL